MKRFTGLELRRVRNDIRVRFVIETLLQLPHKEVEGVYRFLCPVCNEFQTGLNPHTNLSRCFRCQKNFNPIDLLMVGKGLSFVQSVTLLLSQEPRVSATPLRRQVESAAGFSTLAEILREQFSLLSSPCSGD